MSTTHALLACVLLVGCTADDSSGFSSGGSYSVNDFLAETDTGSSDEDTEDTVPEGPPVIDTCAARIDNDYPGYDFVFALEVSYTDDDDNVDEGYLRCTIEVDGGSSQYCITGDGYNDGKLPIDGLNPYNDNSTVYLYLDPGTYDEDQSFYFEVSLIDTDSNESDTAGAFVE